MYFFLTNLQFQLNVCFINVFRRSIWNMYRIEWEIIAVEAKGRSVSKEDLGTDSSLSEGDLTPGPRGGSSTSLRV